MKRVKIKIHAERIGLIVFGLFIGLLVLEGVCRLFYPKPHIFYHESALYGLEFTPNDEGWYSMPPDAIRNKVIINSKGLRDVEHSYDKPNDVTRILILGDSYAAALEIPLEETFPRIMESILNEQGSDYFEVINGSAAARSTIEEYRFYKNEGYKYHPDLVILAFAISNDLRLGGSINVELKKRELNVDTKREINNVKARLLKRIKSLMANQSRLYYVVGNTLPGAFPGLAKLLRNAELLSRPTSRDLYIYAEKYPPFVEARWGITFELISNLNNRVKADGARFAVLIIPNQFQIFTKDWDQLLNFNPEMRSFGWDLEKPNKILDKRLKESNLPFLDLLPFFRQQYRESGKRLYLRIDNHFNKRGHQLTAHLLSNWLKSNEIKYR